MNKIFFYLIVAILPIIFWGSSFLGTRILLDYDYTPNLITFVRFFLATIMLFLFKFKKIKTSKIKKEDRVYILLMAIFGISLFYFFENSGLKYTTVSNTGLITSTIPFFTLITAHFFFHKKITTINFIGIILGILGTVILFYKGLLQSTVHFKGDLLIFGSVGMWLVYSFAYRKVMDNYSSIIILFETFLWGTVCLIPFAIYDYVKNPHLVVNYSVLWSFFYLAVICSFLAYLLWNIAIRNVGIKLTSNLILLIPIISIIVGVVFLEEELNQRVIYSAIFIIIGAYLTSKSTLENHF